MIVIWLIYFWLSIVSLLILFMRLGCQISCARKALVSVVLPQLLPASEGYPFRFCSLHADRFFPSSSSGFPFLPRSTVAGRSSRACRPVVVQVYYCLYGRGLPCFIPLRSLCSRGEPGCRFPWPVNGWLQASPLPQRTMWRWGST